MSGQEELQLDMWRTAVDSMKRYLRSETHGGKVYLAEFQQHYKLLQTGELVRYDKALFKVYTYKTIST